MGPMKMNKYLYLVTNFAVFGLGNLVSKMAAFLLVALYTQYLTANEYGNAELIVTTISLLIPIFTLSISDASLRFMFDDINIDSVVSNGVLVSVVGTMVLSLLSPLLSIFKIFDGYLVFLVLLFATSSFEDLLFNVQKGLENIKICAFNSLVSVIALSVCSYITIVKLHFGMQGYLVSLVISHLCSGIYLFFSGKVYKRIKWHCVDTNLLKNMLAYSCPFIPSTVAWWINSLSDRYLVVFFLGGIMNGLYSAASKIPSILSIATTLFHQAWQISGLKEYNEESYDKFYSNVYNVFSLVIFSITSIVLLLVPMLSNFLYQGEFCKAWVYVPFLLIGTLFSALGGILSPAYLAVKKTAKLMVSTIFGAVVNILVNILLLEKYGLQIASISTMLSFFVLWLTRFIMIKSYVSIKANWMIFCASVALLLVEAYLLIYGMGISYQLICCVAICFLNLLLIRKRVFAFLCNYLHRI